MSTKREVLSRSQLYQLCEALKERRQELVSEAPPLKKAAEKLGVMLSYKVPKVALQDAMEATGIRWTCKTRDRKSSSLGSIRSNAIRTLTVALHRLYDATGQSMPEALKALHALITGRATADSNPSENNGSSGS